MSAAAAGGSQRNGSSLRDRNMKKTANGTSPGLAFARRKTKEETTRSTRSSGRSVARASPAPPAFEKLVRGDHLLVRADYREESYGIRREAFAQQVPPRRLKEAARARASLARFCFCSFGERYVLRFRPLLTLLDEVIRCLGGQSLRCGPSCWSAISIRRFAFSGAPPWSRGSLAPRPPLCSTARRSLFCTSRGCAGFRRFPGLRPRCSSAPGRYRPS